MQQTVWWPLSRKRRPVVLTIKGWELFLAHGEWTYLVDGDKHLISAFPSLGHWVNIIWHPRNIAGRRRRANRDEIGLDHSPESLTTLQATITASPSTTSIVIWSDSLPSLRHSIAHRRGRMEQTKRDCLTICRLLLSNPTFGQYAVIWLCVCAWAEGG